MCANGQMNAKGHSSNETTKLMWSVFSVLVVSSCKVLELLVFLFTACSILEADVIIITALFFFYKQIQFFLASEILIYILG